MSTSVRKMRKGVLPQSPYAFQTLASLPVQAQFSHMGASSHLRTPFTYRVPEDSWACVFLSNLFYALGPHLLAYRCLLRPTFFLQPPPTPPGAKKQQ